jgi:hypothetical protein
VLLYFKVLRYAHLFLCSVWGVKTIIEHANAFCLNTNSNSCVQ